jgi:hypothetical protein
MVDRELVPQRKNFDLQCPPGAQDADKAAYDSYDDSSHGGTVFRTAGVLNAIHEERSRCAASSR